MFKPSEVASEDKKKGKVEKVKKCIRTAAGISWEDPSLLDWETGESVRQAAASVLLLVETPRLLFSSSR